MKPQSVLVIAHGHPHVSKGGGEIVAYTLFQEYRRRGLDATFLARADGRAHGDTAFSTNGNDRELLFHTAMHDYFTFRSAEPRHVWKEFRDLLVRTRPSVVHFHHYVHLGLELIREVRRTLPEAKIVLTLHEFLLQCHHQGQMVKTGSHQLCYQATPEDCSRCFPERSASDFFLRQRYLQTTLADVDAFVCPSRFVRERYVSWGLPAERVHLIENGYVQRERIAPRELVANEGRSRFSFFGQINPYKGILILLEAFKRLPAEERARIHLDVHGSGLKIQPEAFQEAVAARLGEVADSVVFHGPYEASEMPRLMASTDWVIVPSTWWENSPVVIDEARAYGRPILCSDIGGMAEKVRDGVDGYHFPVGDALALADLVTRVSRGTGAWDRVMASLSPPANIRDTAERQLSLYRQL